MFGDEMCSDSASRSSVRSDKAEEADEDYRESKKRGSAYSAASRKPKGSNVGVSRKTRRKDRFESESPKNIEKKAKQRGRMLSVHSGTSEDELLSAPMTRKRYSLRNKHRDSIDAVDHDTGSKY